MKLKWTSEQYGIATTQAPLPDGSRVVLFRRAMGYGKSGPDWHWFVELDVAGTQVSGEFGEFPGDMPLDLAQAKLEAWAGRRYPLAALGQLEEELP